MRFGKKGKLASRYIGPFEIRARVGEMAYRLVLPPELSRIHPVVFFSRVGVEEVYCGSFACTSTSDSGA